MSNKVVRWCDYAGLPVLALARAQRLAGLGAGQPLAPLAVELALVAQHAARRLRQLAPVHDVEAVPAGNIT